MKCEIIFEQYSALSIAVFSVAKELVKMTKEVGLDANPKCEGEYSSLKEGPMVVFP